METDLIACQKRGHIGAFGTIVGQSQLNELEASRGEPVVFGLFGYDVC